MGQAGALLESGYSKIQALCCNSVVQTSAILGGVIGLAVGSVNDYSQTVLISLIAGNFIYLSMVDMLPRTFGKAKGFGMVTILICVFCVGIAVMYGILYIERALE